MVCSSFPTSPDGSTLLIGVGEAIVSERLRLTPLTVDDAGEMHPVLADPDLYRFTGDVAWLVGVAWQRQGIATEAVIAMCTWLEAQGIGWLEAHIHPDHHASARIAHAVGMTPGEALDPEGERISTRTT